MDDTAARPLKKKVKKTGNGHRDNTAEPSNHRMNPQLFFGSDDRDTDLAAGFLASVKEMSLSPSPRRSALTQSPFTFSTPFTGRRVVKEENERSPLHSPRPAFNPEVFRPKRLLSRPPIIVMPSIGDIYSRGRVDPTDPDAVPFINPWSDNYFIGSVKLPF